MLYEMNTNNIIHATKQDLRQLHNLFSAGLNELLAPCCYYDQSPHLIQQRLSFDKRYFTSILAYDCNSQPVESSNELIRLLAKGYVNCTSDLDKDELIVLRRYATRGYLFTQNEWSMAGYHGHTIDDEYYLDLLNKNAAYWLIEATTGCQLIDDICIILAKRKLLPPVGFRIDNINFGYLSNVKGAGGVYWHKDAAGHAIRYFITINSTGCSPSTSVIPFSHILPSYGVLLDFVRSMYTNITDSFGPDVKNTVENRLEECLARNLGVTVINLAQSTGQISAWDFNTFHRATIPANNGISSAGGRHVIMIDFMPIDASNYIVQRNLAPCGPGQLPIIFQEFPKSEYIDKTCIHELSSGYIYADKSRLSSLSRQLKRRKCLF